MPEGSPNVYDIPAGHRAVIAAAAHDCAHACMCDLLNSVLLVYDVFDFVRLLVLHQSGHTGADLMLDDVRVFLDEFERQTNRMGILRIYSIR